MVALLLAVLCLHQVTTVSGFSTSTSVTRRATVGNVASARYESSNLLHNPRSSSSALSMTSEAAYTPVKESTGKKSLHPKIGDVVRYYDLDGGKRDGQVLVGRITFLFGSSGRFVAEITQLEDVRDGYYAEYSSTKRMGKKTERLLTDISPVLASYVQSEQAYKIPMEKDSGGRLVPRAQQETYDLDDYEGPMGSVVNAEVLESDQQKYQKLKFKLLKDAGIVGLVGTVVVNVLKGTEDAAIYLAGVVGSLLYLVFLSLKTDTMASGGDGNSKSQQLGSPFANLRFLMPVLVLAGVSIYNQSRGDANPLAGSGNMFDTVTTEQFAVAVLGFLTYRAPLFVGQVQDAFAEFTEDGDAGTLLPGSAGIALKALQKDASSASAELSNADDLTTVLLVSGPQFAGRTELVQSLVDQDERLVAPKWLLRRDDGATFERMERREEFLALDETESSGLTKNAIFEAAASAASSDGETQQSVVVVDASVDLAKKLQRVSGTRLIGVWVGLQAVSEFEERIEAGIANGSIPIPPEETKESVVRARIKDIISEIEYGLGSGIFEFTVLKGDPEQSLKELKQAAAYAFK